MNEIESQFYNYIRTKDIRSCKRVIRKTVGLFDTYCIIHNPYCVYQTGPPLTIKKDIIKFISDLQTFYADDELSYIELLQCINKHITPSDRVLYSLKNMIIITLFRYIRYPFYFYLSFVESLFTHIKLYTKELITDIFYTLLLDKNNNISTYPTFLEDVGSEILNMFMPYIDAYLPVDLHLHNASSRVWSMLSDGCKNISSYNIDLFFLLFRCKKFKQLADLHVSGYNISTDTSDFNYEWEYVSYYLEEKQSPYESQKPLTKSDNFLEEVVRGRYLNYKLIKRVENYIRDNSDENHRLDNEQLGVLRSMLSRIDLKLRLMYNVSPFIMCKQIEIAKLMNEFKVDKSNSNGLFYVHLYENEELFLYMMEIGIDPAESRVRLGQLIETTTDSQLMCRFKKKLELLVTCQKQHQMKLQTIFSKEGRLCGDICNIILTNYL